MASWIGRVGSVSRAGLFTRLYFSTDEVNGLVSGAIVF
jgi:hypothetical protein